MASHVTARAPSRRPTIADVARAAGVAASTVSLVMNDSGPVSAATRARVLDAARALGYRGADPLARSLRRGRCGVVGVVVGERLGYAFRDPLMVGVLDGLAEEIGAAGSSLLLVPAPSAGQQTAAPLGALAMDAAVLLDCEQPDGPVLTALRARGIAVVGVDDPIEVGVPLVRIDDEGATAALVTHLTDLGHRRLGVVALPLGLAASPGVPRRRTGAARAALATVPGGTAGMREARWNVVEEGERLARELLDGDAPPTALVAQSDVLALGCLRAAADRGLRVPQDVSVVGFDGVDLHLVDGTTLTTVVQPAADKGRAAARLVAALLDGEQPADVHLPTELRVGTTSGPAPR